MGTCQIRVVIAYSVKPELIERFTHLLGSLELNTEFASVLIDWILPLWSNAMLENKAVGTNIQTCDLDNIAPGAVNPIPTHKYHSHKSM